jgi:hypothetical protein
MATKFYWVPLVVDFPKFMIPGSMDYLAGQSFLE